MENIIDREYELNEGVFVLHNALEPLYEKYKYTLPQKIKNQLKQLVDDTEDLIANDDLFDAYDIIKEDLLLKIRYKKFIPETLKIKKGSQK